MSGKKIAGFDWGSLVMPAVVLGGAYLLYNKFFGNSAAQAAATANSAGIDQNTAATSQTSTDAAAKAGSKQTITDTVLNTLANTLYYQMTNQAFPGDIVQNVIQVNTWADWQRLVALFGTKQIETGFGSGGAVTSSQDLGTMLKQTLDAEHISEIDSFFSMQGIPVIL